MDAFTIEIMTEALKKGDWGINICDGNNFYKALFKIEKKEILSKKDAKIICGSCSRWMDKTEKMMDECKNNGTKEDVKAVEYGEQLMEDVLEHVHKILSSMPHEDENFIKELMELAKTME